MQSVSSERRHGKARSPSVSSELRGVGLGFPHSRWHDKLCELRDESLVAHYESIRRQLDLDRLLISKGIKLAVAPRQRRKWSRATALEQEFAHRGPRVGPMEWRP